MRASVFIATSLDGYIARSDGSLDWLGVPDENEDYGFAAFLESIDALVMGRNTYDAVRAMGEEGGAALFMDFCHPNALGSRVIARALGSELESW